MKETKFRVWDNETNTMIYPDSELETIFCFDKSGLSVYHNNGQELSSFELMQYTSIKDAAGTEMFEGDIVEYTDSDFVRRVGIIEFDIYAFTLREIRVYGVNFIGQFDYLGNIDDFEEFSFRVIGNIFENKILIN